MVSKTNYINQRFGTITVIRELETHITPNSSRQRIFRCKCDCGNEFDIRLNSLKKIECCSKCAAKNRRVDVTGKRYGHLVVLSMADDYISPSGDRLSRCLCKCDCGREKIVNLSELTTGKTLSCGCLRNTKGLLKDNEILMDKYDFERNKNLNLNELTSRSSKKVWWKCKKCGNSWLATIASQNDENLHDCPYCSGRLVMKGKTDLQSNYPNLVLKSWDYEKNDVKPDEISCHSSKKIWWKCSEGHSWLATVHNVVEGSSCPICNKENVNSFCEQATYYYIKKLYSDAINGDKHLGMELDIYIPSRNVAIEYDGDVWHCSKKKIKTDEKKNDLCLLNNIKMIRIREPKLSTISNCIVIKRTDSTTNKSLDDAILSLIKLLGGDFNDVDTKRDSSLILQQIATKKFNNSLASNYPNIASEWHPTKNGQLTPDKVNKGSRFIVWWKCPKGHEYQMKISDRTRKVYVDKNGKKHNPQGCPICSSKQVVIGYNDLKSCFPNIASEWHPTKNGELKPSEVMPGSGKEVWWLGKCGHEWKSTPNKRCYDNAQCPVCYRENKSPSIVCIETNIKYKNAKEAGQKLNIKSYKSIYKCCRGEYKTVGGYHWKYSENK